MNIVLSGTLQRFTAYRREHSIDAGTIQEGIQQLVSSYPALDSALFDASGDLRGVHVVFLNGSQVTAAQLSDRVQHDDQVEILTAIAGG